MKEFLSILFTVVFSYLIGSINSAITVCRILKKKDIRDYGSGNAGLTNVLRVFGKGPALATLLADLAKGVIAVVICRVVVTYGFDIVFFENKLYIGYIAGLAVMLGHIFPVFYGFHGGKGVLITATTLLAIDPLTCLLSVTVFAIVLALSKYVSLGSICAAVAYPIFTVLTQNWRGIEAHWVNAGMACIFSAFIIFMHRSNIHRLLNGTENKFGSKKKDKSEEE
ncbi:glycerol-3-phosphate acyltransferase PlsY [Ruminococcaceae bacterium FB2012]|nr:glycerol-3-phosphate acyltransferase PlsY [Ruminococcaceae bacterium FB2012]